MFLKILNGDIDKKQVLIKGINKRHGNSLYICNDYDTHFLVRIKGLEEDSFLIYPYEYSVIDIEPSDRTIECFRLNDSNFIALLKKSTNCQVHYDNDKEYDMSLTFRSAKQDVPFVGVSTPERKLPIDDLVSWNPYDKEKVVYILRA